MISTKIFLITLLFAGALLQVPNCKTPVGTDSCSACNEGFSKTPKAADATKFECTACGAECKKCKEGTVAATPGDCEECKQAEGFGIDAADKKNVLLVMKPTVRFAKPTTRNVKLVRLTSLLKTPNVWPVNLHVRSAQKPTFVLAVSPPLSTWTQRPVRLAQMDVPSVRTIRSVLSVPPATS